MFYELVADADAYVTLEESNIVRVPLTAGYFPMRVILPTDWRGWPQSDLKSVLAHELAHVRRRDPFFAWFASLNKTIFWFHPLAWWLERRLSVLAEDAADEAGVAASADAWTYAQLLLNIAAELQGGGQRLVWTGASMSGPVIVRRIQRVLQTPRDPLKPLGRLPRAMLATFGVIALLCLIVIDFGRLSAQSVVPAHTVGTRLFSREKVALLEQQFAANPQDEDALGQLLIYYRTSGMDDRWVPLVLALIDEHPDSILLRDGGFGATRKGDNRDAYLDARNRWSKQIALRPQNARVLCNAARFFGNENVHDEVELLKRARAIDAGLATQPLARLYSIILTSVYHQRLRHSWRDSSLAGRIRSELANAGDLALLGLVTRYVVEEGARTTLVREADWDFRGAQTLAAELVAHAQAIDPLNREWPDLMEGVKEFGVVLPASTSPRAQPERALIRLDPEMARSMLLQAPLPKYPELPNKTGTGGVIKLDVHIGVDGHVTAVDVLSGGPSGFTNAAIDAAMRYVYQPAVVKGEPVEVITEVNIAFRAAE